MKQLLFAILLFCSAFVSGQKPIAPTDFFVVQGEVKSEMKCTLDSLRARSAQDIGDVKITNHLGELKKTLKNVQAVKVKDMLKNVEFGTDSPKLLSEFYFVFEASDGYKVVFSWNEIFNSPLGDSVFFIVGKDGQTIENQEDRIALICPLDFNTGRRYVKSVSKVWVKRV